MNIFKCDGDRMKFLNCLINAMESGEFVIYAYCLMDNHVHLLVKEGEDFGISIKRIGSSYVMWYNHKYARSGPLFNGRYKSIPVETERYFITVLRYIHQNPLKAGLVARLQDYPWSSFVKYQDSYKGEESFIDTKLTKAYFPRFEDFHSYMKEKNDDQCSEHKPPNMYTDDALGKLITETYNIDELGRLPKKERNRIINDIYNKYNVSIRQLSRVLGTGKYSVEDAVRSGKSK